MGAAGLLLAAGAGRRMGGPKALVRLGDEPLVLRALRAMTEADLDPCVVVLGASADAAAAVLPAGTPTVVAPGWDTGMGASLRAGLRRLAGTAADAAVVHLVDTPGIGAAALARVAARATPDALARGAYAGRPGHPVALGRDHWEAVLADAGGDAGARGYLAAHRDRVLLVEVGDVADPGDLDTPADLAEARSRIGGDGGSGGEEV